MASTTSGGAASTLFARILLLVLNVTLFGLGITLLVMGTNRNHYSGLMSAIYRGGGLSIAIFEEPDAALMITGMFLTVLALKVSELDKDGVPCQFIRHNVMVFF